MEGTSYILFMRPVANVDIADLHQIIKSGQKLTIEHVQYFVYQILRGRHIFCIPSFIVC